MLELQTRKPPTTLFQLRNSAQIGNPTLRNAKIQEIHSFWVLAPRPDNSFFLPDNSNHQISEHKSIFGSLLQKKSCRAFVRAPQNRVLDSSEAFVINSEHFLAHLVTRRASYSAVILLFQKKIHACWQDTISKWVALHIFLSGTTRVVPLDRHDVWFSNETYLVEFFEGRTFVVILKQRNHHLTHSGRLAIESTLWVNIYCHSISSDRISKFRIRIYF